MKYYLHDRKQLTGPFKLHEITAEQISSAAYGWREGEENWKPIEEVPELFKLKHSPPGVPDFHPSASLPTGTRSKSSKNNKTFFILSATILVIVLTTLAFNQNNQNKTLNQQVSNVQQQISDKENQQQRADDERQKQNDALEAKNRHYRNNWTSYISLVNPGYDQESFGGLKNVKVAATNETEYTLNQLQVAVNYIKEGGGIYKTETVYINDLPPHSQKTVDAPSSPRGTSVTVSLMNIYAKDFSFCYNITKVSSTVTTGSSGDRNDPWRCR